MNATLSLMLQVDKLYLIILWISNMWKYFVPHQPLVPAGNLALFCNYRSTWREQNVIYVGFAGLSRCWFTIGLL